MTKPFYITKETWDSLTWKEQDFIIFLRERKYTKAQIMRKLYITTEQGFWKIRKRVREKISGDLNRVDIQKD